MPINKRTYLEFYRYAIKFFGSLDDAVRVAESEAPRIHFKHKVKRARESRSNLEIARVVGA